MPSWWTNRLIQPQMFDLMQAHMTGLDPVLELEAYDRWLYGEALAAQRKETEQSVSKEEQSVFTFLVDCQYKVWERHTVTVNADTYEEAKQRVINLAKNHPVSTVSYTHLTLPTTPYV